MSVNVGNIHQSVLLLSDIITSESDNNSELRLFERQNPTNSELQADSKEVNLGIASFINPYAILLFPSKSDQGNLNVVIDNPYSERKFSSPSAESGLKNLEPTVSNLVNSPPDGAKTILESKTPYRYTDFLYCKYYGKIPNNYLITLRRYPAPTYDNLDVPNDKTLNRKSTEQQQRDFKPIAQAVTWLGEETENKLSDIIGFDVKMNWEKIESKVEVYHGNEQGDENDPTHGASKFLAILSGNTNSAWTEQNAFYDPYATGPYSHRVYGPVNVIMSTTKRARGLDFSQSFNINFHYSLKSIGGINPKAAMLDIMSNMLQLTYNNAAFWGGANRYFPRKPMFPFLGGKDGMNAWYQGDPVGYTKSVSSSIGSAVTGLSKFFEAFSADPIAALKKIATDGASLAMNMAGRGKAPDLVAMKALLTGEPVGEWHMIIGNPYSPILKIGNLICNNAKFKLNDTLGADNFPTELTVTVSLDHGRPRDAGDIQSMFNEGEGRIYYAPNLLKDAFKSSAQENSSNDTSFKNTKSVRANSPGTALDNVIETVKKTGISAGHQLAINMGISETGRQGALQDR